jgi:hypothetical protein
LKRQLQQQQSAAGRVRKDTPKLDLSIKNGKKSGIKGKGKSEEDDPLALIRREIAVMKKLE